MSEPCRSEHDFWAEREAEQARLDQALYNFRKRERQQRPGWFRSYRHMAKWVGIWLLAAGVGLIGGFLLAAVLLYIFVVGWMAL